VATGELVGIAEIAQMAGVSAAAVANWRKRSLGFPTPVTELRSGPIFEESSVRRWLQRRKKVNGMTNVIATINLKGGVGKTTTTCAFAEMLVVEQRQRVLVVDLDPQTNLTTVLIGEDRWEELNDARATLAQLFKDALEEDRSEHAFDLDAALQRGVSAVSDVRRTGRLDLLPSSLDLIDVQDRLATMPAGRFGTRAPGDILSTALRRIQDEYDWIVIDCPPNLGLITLNGLRMAQGYIIPTIPDVLSTYGIPQIVSRIDDFANELNQEIEAYGIVISKYRDQSTVHRNTVSALKADPRMPPVFETMIPEADAIAASAEFVEVSTLRQKYSYQGRYQLLAALTDEIVTAVEAVPAL
jgi:chromosome partitioning protein